MGCARQAGTLHPVRNKHADFSPWAVEERASRSSVLNSLDLDVVAADPSWQEQTLSSAVSVLENPSATSEEKHTAIRILRFLDTPGSVRELVRLMGSEADGKRWDFVAGLAGSRYQSLAVQELERQMASPNTAITAEYLMILGKLKSQLDHEALPPYPQSDEKQQKAWQARAQTENSELQNLLDSLYRRTATLVNAKQGAARSETVRSLLVRPSYGPNDSQPLTGVSETDVLAAFRVLSPDEQWTLLSTFWGRLRVPAMAEPLADIVKEPEIRHQMLRDMAIKRLHELSPNEATPLILDEIRHPHVDDGMFTVKGKTLAVLPNKTLPEFDQLLANRLEQKDSRTKPLDSQLIGRYATKSILARVKAIYETGPGQWDCQIEDGLVLYFLRVAPDYGVQRLAQSPSFCMSESVPAVIRMKRWNEVEPGIVAALNNPDLNRARQAAETLAKYGTPKAEEAMWVRLRRFHAQWAEREKDLTDRPGIRNDATEAIGFQYGLVESLGRAQAWVLDNDQITELETLTLGQERERPALALEFAGGAKNQYAVRRAAASRH